MTSTPSPSRTHRWPAWARWLLGVGGVVVVLSLAVALWLTASLSGGFDDLLDIRHPSADDDRVVRAGESAVRELERTVPETVAALTLAVPALGPVVATTTATSCSEGQHNFKIDDPYDLLCTARHVSALAPSYTTARDQVAALHAALLADRWLVEGVGPRQVLSTGLDAGRVEGRLASYRRGEDRLWVKAATQGGFGEYELEQLPAFRTPDGGEVPAEQLTRTVPAGGYTLLLDVERVYFEE